MVAAFVAEVLALLVAVGAAGAGHGTYLPAKLLFPYTMLLTRIGHTIGPAGILLALVQFPVYGVILRRANANGVRGVATLTCGLAHGVFTILALILADPAFTP